MARLAAVDIGSNALRLRIVDVEAPHDSPTGPRFAPFREVRSERASVRLGHDVFVRGELDPRAIADACDALRRFREVIEQEHVDRYRAVATSAVREARNAELFVERAEREAGLTVEVIEGIEEARLLQLAVRERVAIPATPVVLVDIGGGSTELTLLREREPIFSRSAPLGTVRLMEAFLDPEAKLARMQRKLLDEMIARSLSETLTDLREAASGDAIDMVFGTGGNIDTLAGLCPARRDDGLLGIDVSAMRKLFDELADKTPRERAAAFGLRADRADTIIPATLILLKLAREFKVQEIVSPGVGLREGVLVDLGRAHFLSRDFGSEDVAMTEACLRVGRKYRFDEAHGKTVSNLALQLFDDLASKHKLGARERILLHAAALLHDVGDFIRYEGHHKHSYYLIMCSDIMGLQPEERELVANVARYHRKSAPTIEHENFRELSRTSRSKVKALAGILRIADALDREHLGKVKELRCAVRGSELQVSLGGSEEDLALELWTVKSKAGLLKEALGLELRLMNAGGTASTRKSMPPEKPR